MKTKAKYIGPDDTEYKNGEVYSIFPIKEAPGGEVVAAENIHGEAYVMPAKLFEPIKN